MLEAEHPSGRSNETRSHDENPYGVTALASQHLRCDIRPIAKLFDRTIHALLNVRTDMRCTVDHARDSLLRHTRHASHVNHHDAPETAACRRVWRCLHAILINMVRF